MKHTRLILLSWLSLSGFANPSSIQAQESQPAAGNRQENGLSLRKPYYQQIDEGGILEELNRLPSFGLYKDTYFITGVPINEKITNSSADAKFQISIRQRLTRSVLPWNTFLMLTYTQKSFWQIYSKSAPFTDNNYNPGLTLGKAIISQNRLMGMAFLAFEHESNGKDSTASRSWNYLVLSGSYFFNMHFSVQAKLWAGWTSSDNPDLYKYKGYGLVALNYQSRNDRLWISAMINPRKEIWKVNTQVEVSLKFNKKANQYFFLQWYQGYAEGLLNYNRYTSMVRVGVCIKHALRNVY